MQDHRAVIEVKSPPEPSLTGSAWVGVVLFPLFAIVGIVLGIAYRMPWLITSSLAISLALLALVAATFLNRRERAGKLRLDVDGGATRIGPAPMGQWFPLAASSLAMLAILTDIGLRLLGSYSDDGGMTFSLMIALVVGWGLLDGWYGLKNPQGLKLTPSKLTAIGPMGKETAVPWAQVSGPAYIVRGRITIPIGKGDMQVGANHIDSDPRLVMKLLDAYRNKPARQSELGDGRVVQRAWTLRLH